jgi:hypothetical protein
MAMRPKLQVQILVAYLLATAELRAQDSQPGSFDELADLPQQVDPNLQQQATVDSAASSDYGYERFFMRMGFGLAGLYSRGHSDEEPCCGPNAPRTRSTIGLSGRGLGVQFSIGGALSSQWLLGAQIMSHLFPGDFSNTSIKYASYGIVLLVYPAPKSGFHSGIGLGYSVASPDSWFDDLSGWSVTPELGYEWQVGKDWRIGACLSATFSRLTTGEGAFVQETARVTLPTLALVLSYD